MLDIILQANLQANSIGICSMIGFVALIVIIFIYYMKKSHSATVGISFLLFCVIIGLVYKCLLKGHLIYPGIYHVCLQLFFLIFVIVFFTVIAHRYQNIVSKAYKNTQDIQKRRKYINMISYAMAISITALPFIVNSWGIPVIGSLEPNMFMSQEDAILRFINNGMKLGLIISIFVFLADNILGRIASPIFTSDESKIMDKFCLYLRSFSEDSNKQEKLLCKVTRNLYPVYAIGDPNSILQPNGADRIYATDDEWKETVRDLASRSKLILLRIGQTDGTLWEISNIIKSQLIHKTIFVAYSETDFNYIKTKMKSELSLNADVSEEISNNPIAFFWDSTKKFRFRIISKSKDIEALINEYLTTDEALDKEYEKELELRKHNLKYMFDKDKIPYAVRRSLNWGIISPIVNMRHWSLAVWGLLLLSMVISYVVSIKLDYLTYLPTYTLVFFLFLFGNRIEWAAGSWSCDSFFLRKQKREAKLMWLCIILGFAYSLIYVLLYMWIPSV